MAPGANWVNSMQEGVQTSTDDERLMACGYAHAGTLRSLFRDEEVAGSNPGTPQGPMEGGGRLSGHEVVAEPLSQPLVPSNRLAKSVPPSAYDFASITSFTARPHDISSVVVSSCVNLSPTRRDSGYTKLLPISTSST